MPQAQPYELAHLAYAAAVASLLDRSLWLVPSVGAGPMDTTQQLLHTAFKYPWQVLACEMCAANQGDARGSSPAARMGAAKSEVV